MAVGVVRQLHHVIKAGVLRPATYVQDIDQARITARDRLEVAEALKLALIGAGAFKGLLVNDFYRSQGAGDAPRDPNFTVAAAANLAKQLMIRNRRRRSGSAKPLIRRRGGHE